MNQIEIKDYILLIQKSEINFKKINNSSNNILSSNKFTLKNLILKLDLFIVSIIDISLLIFYAIFFKKKIKKKNIVFTAKNFCTNNNGVLEDRVIKPLSLKNVLFVNSSKEIKLKKINNIKVYNIGGVVNVLKLFLNNDNKVMNLFTSHKIVNEIIFFFFPKKISVYVLWFYDLNSLSLIFSRFRKNILLSEIQHGSIINYPPYKIPSPIKIADNFYVKNRSTIKYLKNNLNKNFECNYYLLPYPKISKNIKSGIHILYASTIEFKGLHPVFKSYLQTLSNHDNIFIKIRLHPREKDKVNLFKDELNSFKISYDFDYSKNWLEGSLNYNQIVISPWSSTLEDAYDNNFTAITIDPVGKKRYSHLIDDKSFFYSSNIKQTISIVINENKNYI